MNSLVVSGIVFGGATGGALLGMLLRAKLPDPHLNADSRDVVKLGTGLIATMSALVLGLLIASAKSSFDAQQTGFQQLSINVVMLDRALANYGPETAQSRMALKETVATVRNTLWPHTGHRVDGLDSRDITTAGAQLFRSIQSLSPTTDGQKFIQNQALQLTTDLGRTRWNLLTQDNTAIPVPFLVVLVFWLAILFLSFGLFAPRNGTVLAALLLCALSVTGAIFLIVDLDQPFEGLIQVSEVPMRNAESLLGQ